MDWGFDNLDEIQERLSRRVREEVHTEDKILVLDIMRGLMDKSGAFYLEEVVVEARVQGVSEHETVQILGELKRDGMLSESEPGRLRLES